MTDDEDFDVYEASEKCPDCGKISYLGFSGYERGHMLVCYRCPSCNYEGRDYMPRVQDILPPKMAWARDGKEIAWFEAAP